MRRIVALVVIPIFIGSAFSRSDAATITGRVSDSDTSTATISAHDGGSSEGASGAPKVRHHQSSDRVVEDQGPPMVTSCTTVTFSIDDATPGQVTCTQVPLDQAPGPAGGPAHKPTPQEQAEAYALDYVRTLPMPRPQPEISAPNGGICGAVHSLDLHIPAALSYTDPDTPFGPLVVRISGSFRVDWGDGTSGTYTTSGAPWPRSEISHSWSTSSHYDLTITADWTANWTFGSWSGVLSGLRTTGSIPNWPVLEAQAVLIR